MSDLNTMTREQLLAHIASLQQIAASKLTIKVSAKGAVSVYGLGRWPVTLYQTQWVRLIEAMPQVQEFMKAHANELATKEGEAA